MARKKRCGPVWISTGSHEPGPIVRIPAELNEGIRKWYTVGEECWYRVGANRWYMVGEDYWYRVGANTWYITAEDNWYSVTRGVTGVTRRNRE